MVDKEERFRKVYDKTLFIFLFVMMALLNLTILIGGVWVIIYVKYLVIKLGVFFMGSMIFMVINSLLVDMYFNRKRFRFLEE